MLIPNGDCRASVAPFVHDRVALELARGVRAITYGRRGSRTSGEICRFGIGMVIGGRQFEGGRVVRKGIYT